MITLKSCPNCDSTRIINYEKVGFSPQITCEIMPGVRANVAIISAYNLCRSCNLIFQNPRMSDTELNKYYSKGYYRKQLNLTDEQMDNDEAYRAKIDGGIIKQQIGEVGSHLDIGGSRGYLLNEIGADTKVVVEPNVSYPRVKGIKVYSDMNEVPAGSFELVTAIHVLEHVSKPIDYLAKMAQFVGRNGHLVIEVPTWKSPGGPLRLAHLYHFEPDVLKLMCLEAGFKVVDTEFTPHLLLICQLRDG